MSRHRRAHGRDVDGIFLLNKSTGMSSNFALQKVKQIFNANKAGHTGALDPLATGMLPICLGEATKVSQILLDSDKTYEVTALLGVRTDTSDADGQVIAKRAVNVSLPQIQESLTHFKGAIKQIPSMYSALKHNGKPLYEYARQGIEITREPRDIQVYAIDILSFTDNQLSLRISCSKGTYIRTIVDDLGELLGCGAHVVKLHRLQVGSYDQSKMLTLDELNAIFDESMEASEGHRDGIDHLLLPIDSAVDSLPALTIPSDLLFKVLNGQAVDIDQSFEQSQTLRIYDQEHGYFLGVADFEDGKLKPRRLIRSAQVLSL